MKTTIHGLVSLTALALASSPEMAMAQATASAQPGQAETQAGPETDRLQDIVVTAQKRAENVQDVPIAISAFTSAALQERAVTSVAQLSNLAPNVNLDGGTPFSGSSAVLSAFIRGIGSDDFAFNIDPGVGIYVDGVYLARTVGANQDLLDVARIEVLKGPQGTLFGRNTIGGAISIITRDPGDHFKFTGDVTTGSYRLLQVRGTVDLPITDDLRTSITFGVKNRQGYLQRVAFPDQRANNAPPFTAFAASGYDSSDREGGSNNYVVRGKMKWDNGGSVRLTLTGDYSNEDTSGIANKLLAAVPGAGVFAGLAANNLPGTALDLTGGGFNFAGLYNFCIASTPAQIASRNAQGVCGGIGTQFRPTLRLPSFGSVNVDGNTANDRLPFDNRFLIADPDKSYATGNSFSKLENWGFSGTIEADIAAHTTVKSITGYRQTAWRSGLDGDASPLNIAQLSFDQRQHQFSEELQLLGSLFDKKVNYVLGGYYFNESGSLHDFVTFDEGLLQVDGPNTFKTSNYAFFGQVDLRPIELIGITLGGRYTHESKDFEGGQQVLNGFNYKLFNCVAPNGDITPAGAFPLAPITCQQGIGYPDPNNPLRVYAPGLNRQAFNNFSPKVGVQLHPARDIMAYGSWSRGYKTGGWTTRLTNPLPDAQSFGEEKAETFEVGIKSKLFDRRLQLNAAAFTTLYRDIQLNVQIGASPTLRNAGDARIKGLEFEAVAAPANGLTISASLGYIDAHYIRLGAGVAAVSSPNPLQAGILVGAPLPKIPKWKFNVSPRYEAHLANGASMVFIADWTHATSIWNDAQRTYALRRNQSDIINASVTFNPRGQKWSLTAGGTNLTDDRYITTGSANLDVGVIYGSYDRPREWYLKLAVNL
jgi:iron complex outermembrane receptor protein